MPSQTQQFTLPKSTPRSSKTAINIAGVLIYLYGIDELHPKQAQDTVVLFHIHGRTRDYHDGEDFAHQVLFETRRHDTLSKGLVVATMDNRNHGTRAIDTVAVQDWKGGNPKHAQDMLSMMDGIVADIRIVMKFLQTYVEGRFNPTQFIISGMSLGGHVAWNMLAEEPRLTAAIVIVGSPNLTDMMVERLHAAESDGSIDASKWPLSIQKLYQERDESVAAINGKEILIMNGVLDNLVPSKFSDHWVGRYSDQNDVAFHVYENTGHCVSFQMMKRVIHWVYGQLN
ncbi:Alpha/Beta hydrolase protein [Aspergillus pseudoustus]|uniref:Alpha/Beta hydrolase protein n=1 Tax=Aspergillus pseudoustus TaxID=1810923 RepID=A0ABR4JCG7_9EURO